MTINKLETHSYPVFVPNDYLFTEYAKTISGYEKMEKWEIYAHAVNDFIQKEGQFGVGTEQLREKIKLQKFVWRDTDEITPASGNTYYWPPRGGAT